MKRKTGWAGIDVTRSLQQSIIDGVAEPILVIDTEYRVWLMNRAAREFYAPDGDVEEPIYCYGVSHKRESPCDGSEYPCPLDQVRQAGQPITVVHQHRRANGTWQFTEVIASPLWAADGELLGIIESIRDITERTEAEKKLEEYAMRFRALAALRADVSESERQRLSRELHDQVGQNLTAIGINLNILRTHLPKDVADAMRARLDDSLMLVEQVTECIRDVTANLRSPVLDDYGLVSALHWYGDQFAWRTSVPVVVEGDESIRRLDPRVENALFRITQEALTNVAKYAQAENVMVTIKQEGQLLRLVIADDGIGFDTDRAMQIDEERGLGLLTMTERAEAVGGRCSIKSVLGKGTQVVVEVPR